MDKSCVRSRVRTRTHGAVGRRRLRPPLTRYPALYVYGALLGYVICASLDKLTQPTLLCPVLIMVAGMTESS